MRRISYDNDIPRIIPDGIFGEQTQNAVMEFQRVFEHTKRRWKSMHHLQKQAFSRHRILKFVTATKTALYM